MKPKSVGSVLASLRDNYYASMLQQMEEADDLYHQRMDKFLPKTDYHVSVHKSSTARNIVDGFRNQMRTDEPTVQYLMSGSGKKADTQRAKNEMWGRSQLRRERKENVVDPNLQVAFDALLRGVGCKKIIVDTTRLLGPRPKNKKEAARWDERALETWPFVSRALDPMTVFPNPGVSRPLKYVVEVQKRTVADLEPFIVRGEWKDNSGENNPAREVEWLEYWSAPVYDDEGNQVDPGWYIVEAEAQQVIEKENPYGFVPYIYEFSGMGRVDEDGNPEHLAISVLTGIQGELAKEVETLTAISAMASSHAFPTILTPRDARQTARQFSGGGAGKIIQYDPIAGAPEYMQPPPPNNNFFLYLERIDGNIRKVASPALQGQREPGVNFGVLQAQLIGQQLAYIRPVKAMLNRVGSQTLEMMSRLVRKFDMDMGVDGSQDETKDRTVSPNDFQHGVWNVEFEAVDPAENDRLMLVGEALRRAGDLSRRTFWRVYAKHVVDDPDEEEALLLAEQVQVQWVQSGRWLQTVFAEEDAEGQEEALNAQVQGLEQAVRTRTAGETNTRERRLEETAGTPNALNLGQEIADTGFEQAGVV